MLTWVDVALGYALYLAVLAWTAPRFARARAASSGLALGLASLRWTWPALDALSGYWALGVQIVVPGLGLLLAYRVSGLFFDRPNEPLERWLLGVDRAALVRTGLLDAYRASPMALRETFELLYLLVYVMLPAGAITLVAGGAAGTLGRYWTIVFAAEMACYAMLPWWQTRPPRAIEPATFDPGPGPLRRLNRFVLSRGSIQVNTLPSGHAAGAVALALAVGMALPAAGAVLLVIAAGITAATVLGRYHYLVDSVLGVGVAIVVWRLLGG